MWTIHSSSLSLSVSFSLKHYLVLISLPLTPATEAKQPPYCFIVPITCHSGPVSRFRIFCFLYLEISFLSYLHGLYLHFFQNSAQLSPLKSLQSLLTFLESNELSQFSPSSLFFFFPPGHEHLWVMLYFWCLFNYEYTPVKCKLS